MQASPALQVGSEQVVRALAQKALQAIEQASSRPAATPSMGNTNLGMQQAATRLLQGSVASSRRASPTRQTLQEQAGTSDRSATEAWQSGMEQEGVEKAAAAGGRSVALLFFTARSRHGWTSQWQVSVLRPLIVCTGFIFMLVTAAGPNACMPWNAAASGRVCARLISCIVPLLKSQQHPPLVPAGRGCQQLCPP